MVRIPLHRRDGTLAAVAVVDAQDRELVSSVHWCLSFYGYVVGRHAGTLTSLHRFLLGLEPGDPREGDHVDRDPLNNRRENLRIVTRGEQMQNVGSQRSSTSQYRGVSFCRQTGRWRATGRVNGKWKHLGRFDTEGEAATAARAFREENMTHAAG